MKNLIALTLAIGVMLGVSACGGKAISTSGDSYGGDAVVRIDPRTGDWKFD